MIYLENEVNYQPDFNLEEVAGKVIQYVLKEEGCPFETEVSITITDNPSIRSINNEYRNIDSETDVLSFPNTNFSSAGDFSEFTDPSDYDVFDPDNGNFILGDIMLSCDRLCSQALEYGHSELREYAFLLAHSTLHLIGYDHMTKEEATLMEQKQEMYLKKLNITRE